MVRDEARVADWQYIRQRTGTGNMPYDPLCQPGSRFLYKMARNSVGAIVRVGSGELSLDEVQHALRHGAFERSRSLPLTAPAHGLVLQRVAFAPEDDPFTGAGVVGERDEEDERAVSV